MKLKITPVFLILIILFSFPSCGVKSVLKKADKKYEIGEYYGASSVYRRAYRNTPSKKRDQRAEIAFKMGNCYRQINSVKRAEYAYSNAVRYKYKDSIVYVYYAEMLFRNGKYTEALKNYQLYANSYPDDIWAKNGIISCNKIKEWQQNKSRIDVKKMDVLNTKKYAEFCPAFSSSDGDVLYFNSSRDNPNNAGGKASQITGLRNNDFFISRKNTSDKWETPTPVEGELNTPFDEGTPSFTSDGKTMYFTRCKIEGENAQIYKSTRAGAQWSGGERVEIFKDSTIMAAHPAISPNEEYLYFVSDMQGGFGGKDIWRAQWLENKWGAVENLGPEVNTPGDEMFPYVRENGELYFSSNGHPGFGGLDIYKAVYDETQSKWRVNNMMEPVNSTDDDFGITFAGNKNTGFFSSNRKEVRGYDKLWSFSERPIEYILFGNVLDTKSEPIADAVIRIVGDDGTNAKVNVHKDGSYRYELKEGVKYVMLASGRGFLNRKEEVSTMGLTDGKDFPVNYQLASVSKPVQVNNIFYEFGKWTLTPESEAGINDLAKILNDNPNITIEIGAHTDMVGSNAANKDLSNKRAQEVVKYLIRAGISSDRLTPVGYGEETPVVVTKEQAKQYSFLKEGDVLDENFVLSKTKEEQEVINQINRRTEFKVLKTTYNLY